MIKTHKLAGALMTLLSGVAFYFFFALKYPYHLHFQEQFQLFESTWEYFRGVAAVPGGFSDWAGRFLTQFFYYAPAGAVIMAILLCAVQILTWASCRRRLLWYWSGLMPVTDLKWRWKVERAMLTPLASSSTLRGLA